MGQCVSADLPNDTCTEPKCDKICDSARSAKFCKKHAICHRSGCHRARYRRAYLCQRHLTICTVQGCSNAQAKLKDKWFTNTYCLDHQGQWKPPSNTVDDNAKLVWFDADRVSWSSFEQPIQAPDEDDVVRVSTSRLPRISAASLESQETPESPTAERLPTINEVSESRETLMTGALSYLEEEEEESVPQKLYQYRRVPKPVSKPLPTKRPTPTVHLPEKPKQVRFAPTNSYEIISEYGESTNGSSEKLAEEPVIEVSVSRPRPRQVQYRKGKRYREISALTSPAGFVTGAAEGFVSVERRGSIQRLSKYEARKSPRAGYAK